MFLSFCLHAIFHITLFLFKSSRKCVVLVSSHWPEVKGSCSCFGSSVDSTPLGQEPNEVAHNRPTWLSGGVSCLGREVFLYSAISSRVGGAMPSTEQRLRMTTHTRRKYIGLGLLISSTQVGWYSLHTVKVAYQRASSGALCD